MLESFKFTTFEVENRAVRSATATGKHFPNTGVPKDSFYTFYESLAKGHVGLLIQEHAFVHIRGYAGHPQLGIHSDEMIQYHKKVNEIMRQANPKIKICCQLAHGGTMGDHPQKVDINKATEEDFEEIVQAFGEAAVRAQKAGYDCVQIHSAHNYMLNSTISDYMNKRTDEYCAKDFLLLKKVFESVKKCGLPTGVKLQCDDFVENCTMNAQQAVVILNEIPFDFVEISGGGMGDPAHKYPVIRPGKDVYYYKHIVQAFKEAKITEKMPVIVTGGMDSLCKAAEALQDGAAMVGWSRKFIRNDQFLLDGDAKKCAGCNGCIRNLVGQKEVCCVVK